MVNRSDGDDTDAGIVRKSRRPVKRPNADLYVHDEQEMDEVKPPFQAILNLGCIFAETIYQR